MYLPTRNTPRPKECFDFRHVRLLSVIRIAPSDLEAIRAVLPPSSAPRFCGDPRAGLAAIRADVLAIKPRVPQ